MLELYSDIPLWSLILWASIAIAISIFFYQKKGWIEDIARWKRVLLIALRSTGLILLALLLLGILLKGKTKEVDQPYIISIFDDSESMLNYIDSAEVPQLEKDFHRDLNLDINERFKSLSFTLGSQLHLSDSLGFNNKQTDLGNALNRVYENYYGRNIGAVVLVSDGNFNAGMTPLVIAEKFKNVPIYTLGVGDTVQKVDHQVKNVTVNEIAFLGNRFPIEVSVEGHLTPNENFDIYLYDGDKLLETKKVKHQDNEYSLIKETFHIDATTVGIHEYTARISALTNEYNLENNSQTFYIEVLDDQSNVLLIAEALSPDVGAIKRALEPENNLKLEVVTNDNLPADFKKYDLIIWDSPGAARNSVNFDRVRTSGKPIWYIITPQTSQAYLNQLQLQATIRTTGQTDLNRAAFNQAFNLFQLSADERKFMDNVPPLRSHYGNLQFNDNSSILAYQKLGSVTKKDPLFYFGKNQSQKFAVTYGTGLWTWALSDYRENQSHTNFNTIVSKTVQYLILKENTSRLRVRLPSISSSEKDFITAATFYNDSYEPITTADVHFELTNPSDEHFDYSFMPLEKEYTLNLGKLPVGRYEWRAYTKFNGQDFEVKGSFAIKDISIEKQDTKANHQVLQQIASNSNGSFALLSDYKEILEQINNSEDIVPIAYESSKYSKLIDYIWLLLLIVAVFTAELFIRRYSGSY